jgi:hypothetical protein
MKAGEHLVPLSNFPFHANRNKIVKRKVERLLDSALLLTYKAITDVVMLQQKAKLFGTSLNSMSWWEEWRYTSTALNLGTRWS